MVREQVHHRHLPCRELLVIERLASVSMIGARIVVHNDQAVDFGWERAFVEFFRDIILGTRLHTVSNIKSRPVTREYYQTGLCSL